MRLPSKLREIMLEVFKALQGPLRLTQELHSLQGFRLSRQVHALCDLQGLQQVRNARSFDGIFQPRLGILFRSSSSETPLKSTSFLFVFMLFHD